MAKKKQIILPFTSEAWRNTWTSLKNYIIDGTLAPIIDRMAGKMFVIVRDDENKCKRVFRTQDDANAWFEARNNGSMTPEILELEFAGETIPGEEQYELRVNITNPVAYALKGSTGNAVFFNFATVDKSSQSVTGEAVDIYFSISNANGVRQKPKVYTYEEGKTYKFSLDDYLTTGINTVTLMVHGRTSGLNKVISMTYEILNFSLTTPFDISKSLKPKDSLKVTYICTGDYQRTVHFYIDGQEVASETISSLETSPTKVKVFPLFGEQNGVGTHTLQLKASMNIGETIFWSDLLYREFEVSGENHTTTLVSYDFPASQDVFNGTLPGFTGTQYVTQSLVWAFYSSTLSTASVLWRLFDENGNETTIGSRQADVVEGETDVMPEPVKFMPVDSGVFKLQALIKGEVIKEYVISVSPNESLKEATDGMMVRLTSIGRSNQEETEYRKDWSCNRNGTKVWCEFSKDFPFTAAAGYNNGGVEFYNRHTGIIKGYKPMAPENASVAQNGFCIGLRFTSYNMDDENAIIARIGNPDMGAGIFVYPNKAVLRSSVGSSRDVVVRFKDEEVVDLYWVLYPNAGSDMDLFTFMQINGVRCFPRIYDVAENYNVGSLSDSSDYGYLHLGDPEGRCGIRVYSIRAYTIYQNERQLQNNFIIDGGTDLEYNVAQNDIYQQGGGMLDVDVSKLEERMPLIKFTGDLSIMEGSAGKPVLDGVGMEFTHPDYYDHYATCELANLKKAGQSTQDRLGPPSLHIKFNKNKSNVLKDRNGKQYPKNRFPILPGYVPENKLRLLNGTLDSSCCHAGGSLAFINEIVQNTQIDGKYPLRTPQQDYVLSGKYSEDMAKIHGGSPSDYVFPYKLSFTPHAYNGAVLYRKDADSPWRWLGLYTFIEEKKAFYANGGHSIRDKIADNGMLDPFDIYAGKKGNVLVDNTGYSRFEIVTKGPYSMLHKGGEETFDTDIAERETEIEKISDPDVEEDAVQYYSEWKEYGEEVVKPLCATEGNQEAFDGIVWNIFNIYNVCAYYIWMIIVCNTDGSFRNINHTRYQTGGKWNIVPWDWDMILGLLQDTYRLDAKPCSDLYTKVNGVFIFNGMGKRTPGEVKQDSYWFWDAVLNNTEFKTMLPRVFAAMYSAGMNKTNWIKAYDRLSKTFSPALYNVDAIGKYISPYFSWKKNYLVSDQGDRTAHRHWFIDTNVDYFEQMYGVGDFVNIRTSTRAAGANNAKIYLKAGATAYFGWTISGEESDPSTNRTDRVMAGEDFEMTVNRLLTSKDILGILSPHKLEKIDMHEFAKYFSADLQFNACYNETTKTCLMKVLNLGMTLEDIELNGCNENSVNTIDGVTQMARLEELNIRGLRGLMSNPIIAGCKNLHRYYAGGSGLSAFNPADGSIFTELELNDMVGSLKCTDVIFPENGIKFVSMGRARAVEEISCPTSLKVLSLSGMGNDSGTHDLLHRWFVMLDENPDILSQAQITCKGLYWTNATKKDVMTLARITLHNNVSGYIYCTDGTFTQEEMSVLVNAFGESVFDYDHISQGLVCDCDGSGINISANGEGVTIDNDGNINILQGCTAHLSGAGFPISGSNKKNYRWRVWLDGEWTLPNDDMPLYNLPNGAAINTTTGEFTTVENEAEEVEYKIECYDNQTFVSGAATIKIVPRTYPNKATVSLISSQSDVSTIDGVLNIIARGAYLFGADNSLVIDGEKTEFTGNLVEDADGFWELEGLDNAYASRDTSKENDRRLQFCLSVTKLPDEDLLLTMKYKSRWKNGTEVKANDVKIALVSVIQQLLIRDSATGNIPLFNVIEAMGISHAQPASYSSMELKNLIGKFQIPADSGVENFRSTKYNILSYLPNVTELDCEGCDTINEDIDVRKMKGLSKVNVSGLSKIRKLDLSFNPRLTDISAINCDALLEIKATEIATNVIVDKASVFVPDNVVESMRQKIGDEKIEPSSDWEATALMWDDGTRVRFEDNNTVIL